jgi:hypothetical protein
MAPGMLVLAGTTEDAFTEDAQVSLGLLLTGTLFAMLVENYWHDYATGFTACFEKTTADCFSNPRTGGLERPRIGPGECRSRSSRRRTAEFPERVI